MLLSSPGDVSLFGFMESRLGALCVKNASPGGEFESTAGFGALKTRRPFQETCVTLVLFLPSSFAMAHPVPVSVQGAQSLVGRVPSELAVFSPELKPVPFLVQAHGPRGNLLFQGQSRPQEDALTLERTGGLLPDSSRGVRVQRPLAPFDVLVVGEASFAACSEACEARARERLRDVCGHGPVVRVALQGSMPQGGLKNPSPRVVFVATCGAQARISSNDTPNVRLSLQNHTLWSDLLSYRYNPSNHMLLDSFALSSEGGDTEKKAFAQQKDVELLSGSEMHLFGKPRFFFPLHFTGNDVRSELEAYMQDAFATSGQLSFFLDVLLFRLKLNLRSSVTLYRDAVHVPVVLSLPISGQSLREGSGLFYGFQVASKEVLANMRSTLPRLGTSEAYVSDVPSFFTEHRGTCVAVAVREPPELKALGFRPRLAFPEDLKALGFPYTKADFGVFCVTELPPFQAD